jgi:hypothetical protein
VSKVCLIRILGNDLPPRHKRGQTRRNTQFILDHEPAVEGCVKLWFVNRIVEPREEAKIIALLERTGQTYWRIPFLKDEYRQAALDTSRVPRDYPVGHPWTPWNIREHHQCLYIMNINAARNEAIRVGQELAEWTLPLDGNSVFTLDGLWQLVERLDEHESPYYVVPLYRLFDNREYFDFTPSGSPTEPQVAFHRGASERFDETLRWGYAPKVELLERLARLYGTVPTPRGQKDIPRAGYALRLFSGVSFGEHRWQNRAQLREDAIRRVIWRLDERPWPRRWLSRLFWAARRALRPAPPGPE